MTTLIWLKKGNLKREMESLLITGIRTNYAEAEIDNTQKNCKCRLCDDRDGTVHHISECNKLT